MARYLDVTASKRHPGRSKIDILDAEYCEVVMSSMRYNSGISRENRNLFCDVPPSLYIVAVTRGHHNSQ